MESRNTLRSESNRALLPRVAEGDREAALLCVERWGARVAALVARFGLAGEAAEVAVRGIFRELWDRAGEFRPDRGLEYPWVIQLARRWVLDRRGDVVPDVDPARTETRSGRQGDLFGQVAHSLRAVGGLDARQRQVLELAVLHGLPYMRIASATGMPLPEVRAAARRGLLRVREDLHGERPAAPEPTPEEARP